VGERLLVLKHLVHCTLCSTNTESETGSDTSTQVALMSLSFSRQATSLCINEGEVCTCLRHTYSLVDREVGRRLDVMPRLDVQGRVAISVQDFVFCICVLSTQAHK